MTREMHRGLMAIAAIVGIALVFSATGWALPQNVSVQIQQEGQTASGWWQRNEGTFLGSFLAALVAVLSVLFTHWLDKRRYGARMRRVYAGLLHSIHAELVWHKGVIRRLRQHLEELKRVASETGIVPVSEAGERFELDYFEQCRLRVLEYEHFSTELMKYLAEYANFLRFANRSIQLQAVQEAAKHFEDDAERRKGLTAYFANVLAELGKIESAIPIIQERIRCEVTHLPEVELVTLATQATLPDKGKEERQ